MFDNIPWVFCENCCSAACPACAFDIIHTAIQDGMLTSTCPMCFQDYSYLDVMTSVTYGEIIVFDVIYNQDHADYGDENVPEMDLEDYEELVTTRENVTDAECPVCLEIRVRIDRLHCGHAFCRDCLFKSLRIRKSCPVCRANC
jgi:hypothetical protein